MYNPNIRRINNNPGGSPVIVNWTINDSGKVYIEFGEYTYSIHPDFPRDDEIIRAMFPNGYQEWEQPSEQGGEVNDA